MKKKIIQTNCQKGGFFVECGAFDGLFFSNSLQFEMNHNWTGLLIEANPTNYQALMKRNRKAWTANVCLSLKPYPTKVFYMFLKLYIYY